MEIIRRGVAVASPRLWRRDFGRIVMFHRSSIFVTALVAALCPAMAGVEAQEAAKFPDWKGRWERIGGGQWDPAKPGDRGQQPPLIPEYQPLWERHIAESRVGGQGYNPAAHCLPNGMPRMMIAYEPMEVIVLPDITYIYMTAHGELRRIYTDGRNWPEDEEPTFSGYSLGRWIDEDGDGRYDVLEIETRNLKGPRIFEPSGIPLHLDNQTIVKERIFADKADPNILRDQVTTIDHALTRPWTVARAYLRLPETRWVESICPESNNYVFIEGETYLTGADGKLMPSRKDQPPPDLRHFNQPQK
jgi:hypothetical protein